MTPTKIVEKIYRDFAAGNGPAVLEAFAADAEFRLTESHPYRSPQGPWLGRDAIARNFLAVAGPEWDAWSMAAGATLQTADAVVVEGRYTGIYKPTGRHMDVEVCHVWRFRGALVKSFHQYVDTAALRRVMRPQEP